MPILIHYLTAHAPAMLAALANYAALAGLLLWLRPLLTGVLRAALLCVFPRLSEGERRMRDRQLLRRMIDGSSGPSLAAELQAMAARG